MATKKRRLADLYVVGREVTLNDGDGEAITVFIRKLNPVDQETALRRANAQRSRAMSIKHDVESDEYVIASSSVDELTPDDLLDYLVEDERQSREPALQAELEAEDEWAKEDYLSGLQEAWSTGGVHEDHLTDPDDSTRRVKDELDRFDTALKTAVAGHLDSFRLDLEEKTRDQLREMVLEKILVVQASIAWLNEYRKCEIWKAVRETDRRTPYFASREEIDELPREVLTALMTTYAEISVDPTEGKDSPDKAASSPSSESADTEEAPENSGLVTAAA